ncbi:MAG: methyltransferase domain-containing protein [Solirubrobacteraceae bacterium]
MPQAQMTKQGYVPREKPKYFRDRDIGVEFQPDVYVDAARVARALGAQRIIDIGCGHGRKLAALHPEFELLGLDYGPNIEQCRARYSFGRWLEVDLTRTDRLPVDDADLNSSVLVCSDVIEHLVDEQAVLRQIRSAMEKAEAILLSTPERDATWSEAHNGPPPNRAHVREWTIRELSALLRRAGLEHGSVGLTRTHDQTLRPHTILAAYCRLPEQLSILEDALIDRPNVPGSLLHRVRETPKGALMGAAMNLRRAVRASSARRAQQA